MKAALFVVNYFLFTGLGFAQTVDSTPIDPISLEGKQIKILNPELANKLFEKQQGTETNDQIFLANGQLQTEDAAKASGAAVLCRFIAVPVNQGGYISFFIDSKLEVKRIDKQSVPSLNLIQLTFTVHHTSFSAGYEHLDRQFTCFNQPGTVFSREALDVAFSGVLAVE